MINNFQLDHSTYSYTSPYEVASQLEQFEMINAIITQPRLGHYLLDSCFSSENFQDGMRAGGSLPLPIIHILSFHYQNLVK